jgi:predicted nuclease of predicted toxin-antitoxin system
MAVRFHLDEHLSPSIAAALRTHGVDITTTIDAHLLAASDEDQLRFALAGDRVMVTQDQDFLNLASAGIKHAGVVFCAAPKLSIGSCVRSLLLYHECCTQDELRGRVEFI